MTRLSKNEIALYTFHLIEKNFNNIIHKEEYELETKCMNPADTAVQFPIHPLLSLHNASI